MKVKQVNLCYPQTNKTILISFNLWTVCIFELWLIGHQKFRENDIQRLCWKQSVDRACWKCWCQEQTEITGPVNVACENSWKIKGKRLHTAAVTQKMSKASPVFQFYNVSVTVWEAGLRSRHRQGDGTELEQRASLYLAGSKRYTWNCEDYEKQRSYDNNVFKLWHALWF